MFYSWLQLVAPAGWVALQNKVKTVGLSTLASQVTKAASQTGYIFLLYLLSFCLTFLP